MYPELIPTFAAFGVSALLVFVANSVKAPQKLMVQATLYATLIALSIALLMGSKDDSLDAFWEQFKKLSNQSQFALACLSVGLTYFFGALYVSNIDSASAANGSALSLPASCDNKVGFEIPTNMAKDDKDFFDQMFNKLWKEIVADLPTIYEVPSEGVAWIDRMIEYTVAGGKMNRGLSTMAAYKTLKNGNITDKERCQAAALGWCVEFLQAFFLVADNVMDDSVTRRDQPCWFRLEEVKLIAINDSFILESCVYKILKKYFGDEAYYTQLVDLFIEVTRQTELGQLLDLTAQRLGGPVDLNRFTMERYISIVRYKTAFYSFYLPIALGMIASGITDPKLYLKAREILIIMGEYFQIQDDYLDCFGAPEVIGKIGTDIQDSKCSWLVVKALEMADSKQRKVLEDNYGSSDAKKVEKVKKLYKELKLAEIFEKYEEESYAQIQKLLSEVNTMPKEVFEFLLRKIYKRQK